MRKMARVVARVLGTGPLPFAWLSGFVMSLAANFASGLVMGESVRGRPPWNLAVVLALAGGSLYALGMEADGLRQLERQYSEAAQLSREEIRCRAVTRDTWTQFRVTILFLAAVLFTVWSLALLIWLVN